MVVRITNKRIICQVVYSTIQGDIVLGSADSTELKNYGIPVGHTNYAPAYATGLLLARRVLKKMGMDDQYKGVEEATGRSIMWRKISRAGGLLNVFWKSALLGPQPVCLLPIRFLERDFLIRRAFCLFPILCIALICPLSWYFMSNSRQ